MTLQGKVALVIGAPGNIGSAVTKSLIKENASVVAVARRQLKLIELARSLSETVSTIQADCTLEDEVQRCFREASQQAGKIDFVVYTPGIHPDPDVPLADYPLAAWRETFDTYVTGFFLVFRESLKVLPDKGHIVAISSAVTRFPADRLPPQIYVGHYSAAKAALDELCKWGRREAHQRGILLSKLAPGAIDTPFHRNAPPHRRPSVLLPPDRLANRIASILANSEEADELIIA
jgi:NAD(P)-dependent dehydrogenase (short-subunit alcohol dehydrogenase family)